MNSLGFKSKKVAVLGFGVEGQSTVSFLLKNEAKITVFDERKEESFDKNKVEEFRESGVSFVFGKFSDLTGFDIVIRSPGIKPEKIVGSGFIATSPIKIFFDLCKAKIIGVTGTKGKGTTSSLIYEMLKKEGKNVFIGGNIGKSPLDFLDELDTNSWVVLELSSFQLQDLGKSPADAKAMAGKPHIAVILMIVPEHLDYHKDVNEYIEAKRNILKFQTASDAAIINRDYPASLESDVLIKGEVYEVSRETEVKKGCFVKNNQVFLKLNGKEEKIIDTKEILLPGKHNLENVCAAVMAAKLAGVSVKSMQGALREFKGLEHRMELVREVNGVRFYDDSFSTTPETAIAAIEAFKDPEILILGGSSKKSDFKELGRVIRDSENIKAIIGIGEEWPRIKKAIENYSSSEVQAESRSNDGSRQARTINSLKGSEIKIIENCKNMEEIVRAAFDTAKPGDVVLLSPACASFGMFGNYKHRGDLFKSEVSKL